jgi:uncharacterized protein (DUF2132 family)
LAKQLTRALGSQPSRRVLTRPLQKYYRLLLGEQLLARVFAIGSSAQSSISTIRKADWARGSFEYMALKEKGLYAVALELAGRLQKQAFSEKNHVQLAWKIRELPCLRALGRLTEALSCGKAGFLMIKEMPPRQRRRPEAGGAFYSVTAEVRNHHCFNDHAGRGFFAGPFRA